MAAFVLVPGAWLGGWAWKKVVPLLNKRGHDVYPVTLTGVGEKVHLTSERIGIETAIQDILNIIKYNDLNDIFLVGHSFAGKIVAAVADRVPERVGIVIYLDAFRPRIIRTPQGSFPDEWPTDGWQIPFPEVILDSVGRDVQAADREWMMSKVTPLPVKYFRDPVTLSDNFDSVKSAFIFCTDGGDDLNEILKEKLDGPVKVIESGHWPMITKSKELTEDILFLSGCAVS